MTLKSVILASTFIISILNSNVKAATLPPDISSSSYQKGSDDRYSWEAWYNDLTGLTKLGAEYWAGERNKPQPSPCIDHLVNGQEWIYGCLSAQQRLSSIDYKRKTDPQYWNGWNNIAQDQTKSFSSGNSNNISPPVNKSPNCSTSVPLYRLRVMFHQMCGINYQLNTAQMNIINACGALQSRSIFNGQLQAGDLEFQRLTFNNTRDEVCAIGERLKSNQID